MVQVLWASGCADADTLEDGIRMFESLCEGPAGRAARRLFETHSRMRVNTVSTRTQPDRRRGYWIRTRNVVPRARTAPTCTAVFSGRWTSGDVATNPISVSRSIC